MRRHVVALSLLALTLCLGSVQCTTPEADGAKSVTDTDAAALGTAGAPQAAFIPRQLLMAKGMLVSHLGRPSAWCP